MMPKYLETVKILSEKSHRGQFYGVLPYFYKHILEVVEETKCILEVQGYEESDEFYSECLAIAYAHDLLEDTHVTEYSLKGFLPSVVVSSVKLITKQEGYNLEEYLLNIKRDVRSRLVKKADISCNLRNSIREGNNKRILKYANYLKILSEEE